MAWNKKTLEKVMKERFSNHLFMVVSSAEPYVHNFSKDAIRVDRAPGGLVTGVEPILKANKGLWIAHGRGTADKDVVDANDKIKLPPRKTAYTLKRLWVNKKNLKGWYYGFSNQALWPLCHNVYERPAFDENDWKSYVSVNSQFADAVLQEAEGKQGVIWFHDYTMAIAPGLIQAKRPDLILGHFWHIPWPTPQIFQICPWGKEILEGMLSNRLIGFQRLSYCKNFLASVARTLEAKVDFDAMTITYKDFVTTVRHYPISVDYQALAKSSKITKRYGKAYIKKFVTARYEFLSLGVERLDYTKGIPERIKAIDRFLEKYPQYLEKFVHINVLVPSRVLIPRYEDLNQEIEALIQDVNFKYATPTWQPIHVIKESLAQHQLFNFYKSADVMMVTSLADGMNLVAKEYVASGSDDGALILSDQAGAVDELSDAYIVNPYDVDRLADAIKASLEMPVEERKARMAKMREIISKQNVYRWAGKFLTDLSELTVAAANKTPQL
jgi:trehalose 6-phosphate synthase